MGLTNFTPPPPPPEMDDPPPEKNLPPMYSIDTHNYQELSQDSQP
jgi:hypothetical protein